MSVSILSVQTPQKKVIKPLHQKPCLGVYRTGGEKEDRKLHAKLIMQTCPCNEDPHYTRFLYRKTGV